MEPIGYSSEPRFARPFRSVVNAVRAFSTSWILGRMSVSRRTHSIGSVAGTTLRSPWSFHHRCFHCANFNIRRRTRELSSTTGLRTRRRVGGALHHFRVALPTLRPLTRHYHALRFRHRIDGITHLLHHGPRSLV